MSEILEKSKEHFVRNSLIYLYVFLFSVNALTTSITASFMNSEWGDLSSTSKFLLVVVIVQNWTGTMLALFNKQGARLAQGQLPTTEQTNEKTVSNG